MVTNGTRKAVIRRCSSKKVFLKISQISQQNVCVGVFFNQVFKNSFFIEYLQWLPLELEIENTLPEYSSRIYCSVRTNTVQKMKLCYLIEKVVVSITY